MTAARSPWRNPMVWLVAGIPLASIIAGVGLVIVAMRQPNDAISEDVRRTAQIQVADLGADARAQQAGLRAVLRNEDGIVEVLPVAGEFDRSAALRVTFRHPARKALDRQLELVPTALGWRAEAEVDGTHDWNVELAPAGTGWRLYARLPANQHAILLQPALESP